MTQNHDDTDAMLNEMMARGREVQNSAFRARDELLPCPFCGGDAERFDLHEGSNVGGSCISCTRCFASGAVEFGFKENFISNWNRRSANEARGAEEQHRKDAEGCERWEFEEPEYHHQGMGCGLEDRGIHDRYQAMEYGWDQAVERCIERIPEELYTRPANVAALEGERDRWRLQAKYETDVAEVAIQRGKDLEARAKELEGALQAQSVWHEAQRKALSKQPQSHTTQWHMNEHFEQIEEIRAALTREGGV